MDVKIPESPHFFREKKKKENNCKDLGISYDLTEFTKIPTHKSLKTKLIVFLKILTRLTKNPNEWLKLKKIEG
jgi:hypothetical protein